MCHCCCHIVFYCYYFVCTRGMAARGEKAFRESFARLSELRSIVKPGEYNNKKKVRPMPMINDSVFSLV